MAQAITDSVLRESVTGFKSMSGLDKMEFLGQLSASARSDPALKQRAITTVLDAVKKDPTLSVTDFKPLLASICDSNEMNALLAKH